MGGGETQPWGGSNPLPAAGDQGPEGLRLQLVLPDPPVLAQQLQLPQIQHVQVRPSPYGVPNWCPVTQRDWSQNPNPQGGAKPCSQALLSFLCPPRPPGTPPPAVSAVPRVGSRGPGGLRRARPPPPTATAAWRSRPARGPGSPASPRTTPASSRSRRPPTPSRPPRCPRTSPARYGERRRRGRGGKWSSPASVFPSVKWAQSPGAHLGGERGGCCAPSPCPNHPKLLGSRLVPSPDKCFPHPGCRGCPRALWTSWGGSGCGGHGTASPGALSAPPALAAAPGPGPRQKSSSSASSEASETCQSVSECSSPTSVSPPSPTAPRVKPSPPSSSSSSPPSRGARAPCPPRASVLAGLVQGQPLRPARRQHPAAAQGPRGAPAGGRGGLSHRRLPGHGRRGRPQTPNVAGHHRRQGTGGVSAAVLGSWGGFGGLLGGPDGAASPPQHGEEVSPAASDLAMVLTRGLSLEHQKSSRDSLQYSSGYSTQTTTPSCSEDTIPSQGTCGVEGAL